MNRCLTLLLTAGLLAGAGAAQAQSAEYRRGYEDGWRAAQEGRPMQPEPVPFWQSGNPQPYGGGGRGRGRIAILEAAYGAYDRVCDARGPVQQMVDAQGDVQFEVTNRLCGDPASGQTKALEVTYQCGRGQTLRARAAEGQLIRIGCR